MRRLFTALTTLLVSAVLAAPAAAAESPVDDRIVGGSKIDISQVPWQLSLQYNGSHYCGATIIAARVAITAAHCTDGVSKNNMSVRAGSSKHASGGVRVRVQDVYQHPRFSGNTLDYDVSVLHLADALPLNSASVGRARLADEAPAADTRTLVTGWGVTTEDGDLPDHLRGVVVPVVSRDTCRASYGESSITPRMLCAGLAGGGKDSCQGDSGGPLVVDNTLVGIVSWGNGCARPRYYGVYTNVAAPNIREWIRTISGI